MEECKINYLKRFSNRRGEVFVMFDDIYYTVTIVRYSNLRTGRPMMSRTYMQVDAAIASDVYNAGVNELKGKPWVEPRTFCARTKKMCRLFDCPKKLGGQAYHAIFSESCVYRIQSPALTKQR